MLVIFKGRVSGVGFPLNLVIIKLIETYIIGFT